MNKQGPAVACRRPASPELSAVTGQLSPIASRPPMKKSTDQRAVSLLLWIFAILAICQLTMQRSATIAIDELSVRVARRDPTRVFVAALDQVRGDLLNSSLLSVLGLALGLLG